MRAIEQIVKHSTNLWLYIANGDTYTVVWASPMEVIAVSDNGAWLGRAKQFVMEFEACAV